MSSLKRRYLCLRFRTANAFLFQHGDGKLDEDFRQKDVPMANHEALLTGKPCSEISFTSMEASDGKDMEV